MTWQSIFSNTILSRGRQYLRNGNVANLTRTDTGTFTAKVTGTRRYDVLVKIVAIQGGEVRTMSVIGSCTCLYEGYCKHMAATMFAIDQQYSVENIVEELLPKEKKMRPFSKPSKKQFYDLSHIQKKDGYDESVCKEAKRFAQKKDILLEGVSVDYRSGAEYMVACLSGVSSIVRNHYYRDTVDVTLGKDRVFSHHCYVSSCDHRFYSSERDENLCAHELALLYLFEKYQETNVVGDYTDQTTLSLIKSFQKKQGSRLMLRIADSESAGKEEHGAVGDAQREDNVNLEPRIEQKGRNIVFLTKVGFDKGYVVRNLTELVDAVEKQKVYPLGKKNKIDFSVSSFSPESQKVYDFIKRIVKQTSKTQEAIKSKSGYYYSVPDITVKDSIELKDEDLDHFFESFCERTVQYTDTARGIKEEIAFADKEPSFRVVLEKMVDGGELTGIHLSGEVPYFFEGENAGYYLGSKHLYRFSNQELQRLRPIMDYVKNGKFECNVGTNHLTEFYRSVLPVLEKALDVERRDEELLSDYIPVEPQFVFYFDAEKGIIFVRTEVFYGDHLYPMREMYSPGQNLNERDLVFEDEVMREVSKYCPYISQNRDYAYCEKDDDAVYKLTKAAFDHFASIGEIRVTDAFTRVGSKQSLKLRVGVSLQSGLLNIEITSGDIDKEELLAILDSFRRKKKYHRLKDGSFIGFDEDNSIEVLAGLYDELRLSPKEFVKDKIKIPVYRALYLDKMLEGKQGLYTDRDTNFKKLVKEFKTVDDSDFEVPKSLADTLRNYQIHGFKWMKTVAAYGFGGILADDMGLGKTLQTIALLLSAKENKEKGTSLICCPASLVYNWQEECRRFAPKLRVAVLAGTPGEREQLLKKMASYDVLVTSYDLLKRDILLYEGKQFLYEIIDEAQFIKTHSTAASKSVKLISARHRFALTGTPIENRLSELWSIFDFLMPGYLFSYESFRTDIETPIVKYQEAAVTERLKRMVSPFIVRRLKSDVLKDLPDKLEEVRMAKFDGVQQKVYDSQVLKLKQMVASQDEGEFNKSKIKILAELTRIRQICCDPSLCLADYTGESAKLEACMDLIESAIEGGHKMLLFSQFTTMLAIIGHRLKEKGIKYYLIQGDTKKEDRLSLVKQFNEDDTPVFLISLKAGGTGLNLVGADVVIHYDPWWNMAVQNQATDRAHRIGQDKTVTVYKLIMKDSIEEKIMELQEKKSNLADEILSGENGSLGKLSKEEILDLIGT